MPSRGGGGAMPPVPAAMVRCRCAVMTVRCCHSKERVGVMPAAVVRCHHHHGELVWSQCNVKLHDGVMRDAAMASSTAIKTAVRYRHEAAAARCRWVPPTTVRCRYEEMVV
jgi:hypothetical protein